MTAVLDTGSAEAARVAQVGYTAVVDRLTPALTHADVAANVTRSVTTAGGFPAHIAQIAATWSPGWQQGAVTVLAPEHREGPWDHAGTVAFGITVDVDGTPGAVGATVVMTEPSARLRSDSGVLAAALADVLAGVRAGSDVAVRAREFADRTRSVDHARLIALVRRGGQFVPAEGSPLAVGEVLLVGATARTPDGPLLFQTSVLLRADGPERLDILPLRLIELR